MICKHLMGFNHTEDRMNEVHERDYAGMCFPEDMNNVEEQEKSYSFIGSCNTGHGISTQSIAMLCVNSVEGGVGLVNCNVNIRLTPENDDRSGNNEGFEKSFITYERRKRRKKTELSDKPTTKLGFLRQDTNLGSTSLDKPLGFESVPPFSFERTSEKRVIAEDGMSLEVNKKQSLEESATCSFDFQTSSSSNYGEKMIGESDDTSKNNNVDMLANNHLKEFCEEAKETVGIVEVNRLRIEEENIGASEVDLSSKQLDGSEGGVSQVAHDESKNLSVDRTFAGYTGKKLLVLDVNGLLVDISSYVPYDYEPDDIILKKAVFKRPHCDDFLKFCFARFDVGVWTSRTKSNVEPILDLLLGSEKSKLLFCWDQSQCTNTGFTTVEKRHKPLLLKKLKKLWNKSDPDLPWERGVYNESNTLLLDDTPYKALSNPRYTAVFPYTYRFRDASDNSLGPGGDLRVYLEGLAAAENVQEYVKQNPFGQRQITEKNLSWGYYRKVIEASSTPPRQTDENDSGNSLVSS